MTAPSSIRGRIVLISLIQLGTVDYATGLRLQEKLVALRKQNRIGDVLLLLEHKPVITLGRNAKSTNILASPEVLVQRGVELFETDRGGDVTFHGPGQIVGYPIFDLRGFASSSSLSSRAKQNDPLADRSLQSKAPLSPSRKHLGAVDFVRRLEEVLIRTCADFAIPSTRVPGLTGVWTDSANSAAIPGPAKLAAIGIHISRFVTSHGFALNVNPDLSFFDLIIPCGITAHPVTSMQRELGRALDLNVVAASISRNFGTVFQSQMLWLNSLDDLLGNTVGVPMQPPADLRRLHKEDDDLSWA